MSELITTTAAELSDISNAPANACPPDAVNASLPNDRTALDPVLSRLPSVLRLQSLVRTPEQNRVHNRATVHHRLATMCVDWITPHVDTRLHVGGMIQVRPALTNRCNDGAVRIQRLLPLDYPLANVNLFDSLLPGWVKDRVLVDRASALWAALPQSLAHLVNAILWDGARLHRFVTGPSSVRGHHADIGGNFRHAIDVAETAAALARGKTGVSEPLLIVGGLLHDLGKAAEYRYDRHGRRFRLSDRGELIGHRDTLIEWLALARSRSSGLNEATWLGLLHMLGATKGAPDWVGLRTPRSLEAEILNMADRLSGHQDLYLQCMKDPAPGTVGSNPDAHFGIYHPHLGVRPYVLKGGIS